MLVTVIGNYNSQNLGDDIYIHLLRDRYREHEFVPNHELGDRTPEFIIYGGGGILTADSPREQLLYKWVEEFRVPYCVLSAGTATGPGHVLPQMEFTGAEFVTVRDTKAARRVRGSELLPDLAWAFKPRQAMPKPRYTGVMLRHSPRWNALDLVMAARGAISILSPDQPLLFMSTYGERIRHLTLDHVTAAGHEASFAVYDGKDPAKYLDLYRHCRRVIAMPYHGIIFAAIFGVRVSGWPYEKKVVWLMKELGLPIQKDLSRLDEVLVSERKVASLREQAQKHFVNLDHHLRS